MLVVLIGGGGLGALVAFCRYVLGWPMSDVTMVLLMLPGVPFLMAAQAWIVPRFCRVRAVGPAEVVRFPLDERGGTGGI